MNINNHENKESWNIRVALKLVDSFLGFRTRNHEEWS